LVETIGEFEAALKFLLFLCIAGTGMLGGDPRKIPCTGFIEQLGPCEKLRARRHPPSLSHFREQGKAGVIGDAVIHGRKLAGCAGCRKPELSGEKIH